MKIILVGKVKYPLKTRDKHKGAIVIPASDERKRDLIPENCTLPSPHALGYICVNSGFSSNTVSIFFFLAK